VGNVTVIGAQWGDEGKGKIVDWLASRADMVVRFQGGHNAGHTLVVGDQTYKLSLLPSGIVRGTPSVIGNGVVLDPWALKAEIEKIAAQGVEVTPDVLMIAETCPLILPIHRDLDALREDASARARSAPRGAASARPMRTRSAAARSASATSPISTSSTRCSTACAPTTTRCAPASASRRSTASAAARPRRDRRLRPALRQAGVARPRRGARARGKRILFEGAQGVLLDVDHGTYPFVTSSNTSPARPVGQRHRPVGGRLRARHRQGLHDPRRLGPFPTELDDEVGQRLGERGHEFGTVTGRQRRCGWFDAVLVRQSVAVSGITGIALTKLDVLDGFETVKICTGYRSAARPRLSPAARRRPGAGRADLRGNRRLERLDARRAQLGRPAGAGDQICPPHRGADPLPGGAGLAPRPSATTRSWCATRSRASADSKARRCPRVRRPRRSRRRPRPGRWRALAQPLDHLLDRALRRLRDAPRPSRRGNCGPSR
jgi:adenylosuccinate synthase